MMRDDYFWSLLITCEESKIFKTAGVNFINIQRAAFTNAKVPKVQKKTVSLSAFFVLSGSAHIKAAHRTLMKLTPGAEANIGSNLKPNHQ